MIPASYDLSIYQGDTYSITLRLRSSNSDGSLGAYVDLTGATPKSEIRDATGVLIAEFDATLLDQTTTPGGVTLSLTHTVTAALTPAVDLLWDFQVTDSAGGVTTYLRGNVSITGEVTQS